MGIALNVFMYLSESNESADVRGLNKIYTVSNIEKNCINDNCKWKITYSYQKIVKTVSVNEPSLKIGDKVYERLICKRVSGAEAGKTYDPRNMPDANRCIQSVLPQYALFSVLEDASKSCGGICSMEFQGVYNSNVAD